MTSVTSSRVLACCLVVYSTLGIAGWLLFGNVVLGYLITALIAGVIPFLASTLWTARSNIGKQSKLPESLVPDALLVSAQPIIFATTLDGTFTFVNHSAERTFALRSQELIAKRKIQEFLADGELERLKRSLVLLRPELVPSASYLDPFSFCIQSLLSLPPSQIRGVDLKLISAAKTATEVTLYGSAIRDTDGPMSGLLAVAVDRASRSRKPFSSREPGERYRDLFEDAVDPVAVLSAEGRFLYSNLSWKSCFGLDDATFQSLEKLEDSFDPAAREQVNQLFQSAIAGTRIDAFPLQTYTADGRLLEIEISLTPRQHADATNTVGCAIRDVTTQKQRERRLALQLAVAQIISQSTSSQSASIRILETLCLSLGWDVAFLWRSPRTASHLQFHVGWASPEEQNEALLQQNLMTGGGEKTQLLAQESIRRNQAVWIDDLSSEEEPWSHHPARQFGMVSGWAIPVRAGNHQIAALEFFSRRKKQAESSMTTAVETVLTSLGQMLARSREQERADELHHTQQILLDTIADGICATDENGLVTLLNPAGARLLRLQTNNVFGVNLHELLHGYAAVGNRCTEECALLAGLKQQKQWAAEIVISREDSTSFPAEFSLTPILESGRFVGSVISFRDITQRFALDKLKDEFVSTVSHELRTPLTSIRGALGLLSSGILGELNDKAANLLRIALSNSDRLVRLINDILDLERIQSGREPLAFRIFPLDEIVQQAIDGMQPVAEAAKIQLIHDANGMLLKADPDRLLQVLTNLLSNAIKFSPPGATVSVTLRANSRSVILSVIDQGRGIPADKLDRIFDRFQQVDASDSRQKGGSGLGLAICRTIVEQHGGKIWAERNLICGSTFRVLLPFRPTSTDIVMPPLLTKPPQQGAILIADSNNRSRATIAAQLRRQGYNVIETTSARETLDALWMDQKQSILRELDAILLDASMGKFNGWEILPLLRQHPALRHTPIVLLSMEREASPGQLPEGADGWIQKTGREEELLRDLSRVLAYPGESARILVIEDDVDLARIIGDVFARTGMDVKLVHTRQDALNTCLAFMPQLIVLDLALPDGDGFNVVDWLRQNDDLAHLPLVVYSAREISLGERPMLQLGPTQFLTKARVQPHELEALVLTMLRRSRQRRESALLEMSEGSYPPESLNEQQQAESAPGI